MKYAYVIKRTLTDGSVLYNVAARSDDASLFVVGSSDSQSIAEAAAADISSTIAVRNLKLGRCILEEGAAA